MLFYFNNLLIILRKGNSMSRRYFFGTLSFNFNKILPLVTLIFLLMTAAVAHSNQNIYRIFNVKSVVRLDSEKEKSFKDFFVNFGVINGAEIGRVLKVERKILKTSEVASIDDQVLNIPIGDLEIIAVEPKSCVARLVSLENRAENTLAVYDTAMIGDIIIPQKKEYRVKKAPEVMILPETILFDFDKYYLKKSAKYALDNIVSKIRKSKYKKVEIASHTDSIGNHQYNLELSRKRSKSIYDYFIKEHGLNKGLFAIKGYGETRPIASNKTTNDRQKNRRGEITFYKE
ncbi:OmpA family protein [Thermodesulfobacteriota bacterium]